jgi:hypothetical protein
LQRLYLASVGSRQGHRQFRNSRNDQSSAADGWTLVALPDLTRSLVAVTDDAPSSPALALVWGTVAPKDLVNGRASLARDGWKGLESGRKDLVSVVEGQCQRLCEREGRGESSRKYVAVRDWPHRSQWLASVGVSSRPASLENGCQKAIARTSAELAPPVLARRHGHHGIGETAPLRPACAMTGAPKIWRCTSTGECVHFVRMTAANFQRN